MATGWDLLSTLVDQAQTKDYYDSAQPTACPRCGEPFRQGPVSEPGILFCPFDGFRYPDDWDSNTMSGM